MIFFVTVLRALACLLITNSHYTGVYPTDLIANGGLIGDILFFAVSGYCLYNVKSNFAKWYGKRLWRIYLPLIIITVIYILSGNYSLSENNLFWWLVFPTYYHFITSIVILYIPYFIILKFDLLKSRIPLIMLVIFGFAVLYYVFFYDKSYYHIDTVREPFIRILFFESMLLGAYFKQNDANYRNQRKGIVLNIVFLFISFMVYFASKLFFSKLQSFSKLQIVNQIFIFVLLYFILKVFSSIDAKLSNLPKFLKGLISFIADITLEVYLVQYVLIDVIKPHFSFPINWVLITVSIIVAACLLHVVCKFTYRFFENKLHFSKK